MSKHSDFPNNRINIVEMLEGTTFDTDVNRALVENTFNRFLTKDQTVKIDALVGKPSPIDPVDRQIKEQDPHRQAFQLQPLINYQSGVETIAYSFKDVIAMLEHMGVKISDLDKWGETEQFNYMPPVTLDKLVNYRDYYWYDETNVVSQPQYVVAATYCGIATSKLRQAQRELQRYPLSAINLELNAFVLLGDQTAIFTKGIEFDVNGAHNVGIYTAEQVYLRDDGYTYIVPTVTLTNSNYGDSYISFNSAVAKIHNERNRTCDGTIGWDSYGWDDRTSVTYVPITLSAIEVDYPDAYSTIKQISPELFDSAGDPVTVQPKFMWEWMQQPRPEFSSGWDGTGEVVSLNPWQVDNKWLHKLDLPQGSLAYAKQATAPIIEYAPYLQFNEWSIRAHQWWTRKTLNDPWEPTSSHPDLATIKSPDFVDTWLYMGSADVPTPCDYQPLNSSAVVHERTSPEVTTWQVYSLHQSTVNRRLCITGRHPHLLTGSYTVFDGDAVRTVNVTDVEYDIATDVTTLKTAGNTLYAQPGMYVGFETDDRPNLLTLNTINDRRRTMAGKNQTRVYVNDVQLVAGFSEWTSEDPISEVWYVTGVLLDRQLEQYDTIAFSIDPAAHADVGMNLIKVRTAEYADNIKFDDANRPLKTISAVRYHRLVQHKSIGEHKIPMFDMYHPTGEHAGRVSPIFYYMMDSKSPVHKGSKQRLKFERGADDVFYFKQFLVDYDGGPMYCYKQFSVTRNEVVLRTIWRSDDEYTYVPELVDENGRAEGEKYVIDGKLLTASLTPENSDWEIIDQLMYNAAHENRVEVSTADLRSHIDSIQRAQPAVPGFKKSRFSFRLLYELNPSLGGTIKEHNGSFDILASMLTAVKALPTDIVDFAETAYLRSLSTLFDHTVSNIGTLLLHTDFDTTNRLSDVVTRTSIDQHETNDINETTFGDSGSFKDGRGIKSWPMTLPLLGWSEPIRPVFVEDAKLAIKDLIHHDGHRGSYRVPPDKILNILIQAVRSNIDDPVSGGVRRRGRSKTFGAVVGEPLYSHYSEIPGSALVSGDLWLDGDVVYRLRAHVTETRAPNVTSYDGDMWFNKSTNLLYVRSGTNWNPVSVLGDHSAAWEVVNVQHLVDLTMLKVETELYEVAKHIPTVPGLPVRNYPGAAARMEEERINHFKDFMSARGLTDDTTFVNRFNVSDPFTWNYSKLDITNPSYAWQPDPSFTKMVGFWKGAYDSLYGTPYPHLEPWKIQGYNSKPGWWDNAYRDASASRRWVRGMWTNVILNQVPAHFDTPVGVSYTLVVDPTSGAAFKRMPPRVQSVPVCIDVPIVNARGDVVYALDDLFPPHDSRIATPYNPSMTSSSIGRPWFTTVPSNLTDSLTERFELGDGSQLEHLYRYSTDWLYNRIKQSLIVDPIYAFNSLWGEEFIQVDRLNIAVSSNNVISHKTMRLHGDYDKATNSIHRINGLNQWYVNYIRDSSQDFKSSKLKLKLNTWKVNLGYAAAGFISPNSAQVSTDAYDLSDREFKVIPKKSLAVDRMEINALAVKVSHYGRFRKRNGAKVPYDTGADWKFTILPLGTNQQGVKYYGVETFEYSVADVDSGILRASAPIPWATGERVYIESTKYAPYPLDPIWTYYVEVLDAQNGLFKLHKQASAAFSGEPVVLRTEGEGIQTIGKVASTFDTVVHSNKLTTWKHHALNKQHVISDRFPVEVTGIQAVIDFVDGYSEYLADRGIIANHDESRSSDPWTGRVISWFTETEAAIIRIYEGQADADLTSSNVTGFTAAKFDSGVLTTTTSHYFRTGQPVRLFSLSAPSNLQLAREYYVTVINDTSFSLAISERNALDGVTIEIDEWDADDIAVGVLKHNTATVNQQLVINPFKQDVWIKTPRGMVSDLSIVDASSVAYNTNRFPIEPSRLSVYRQDKLTRINARRVTDDQNLVIGGAKIQVDGYEHVILLNHYNSDGYVMYDPYVGNKLSRINVRFVRGIEHNMRPGLGGYYVDGQTLKRNIEGAVTDMRSYYDTTNDQSVHGHAISGRELLGFDDAPYLNHLNSDDVTKFTFWKGSLRYRGASKSVKSLINHTKFVDATVDEYWAFKLADFGDIRPKRQFKVKMKQSDTSVSDLRYTFRNWKRNSTEHTDALIQSMRVFDARVTQTTSIMIDGIAQAAVVNNLEWKKVSWLAVDGLLQNADIFNFNMESYEQFAADGIIATVDIWDVVRKQSMLDSIDGWLSTVDVERVDIRRSTYELMDSITPSIAVATLRRTESLFKSGDGVNTKLDLMKLRYNEPGLTVVGGMHIAPYLSVLTKDSTKNEFGEVDIPSNFFPVPTSEVVGASFDPNGDYLAVRTARAPHLIVYYRTGIDYIQVFSGATLGLGDVVNPLTSSKLLTWVEFGATGEYLYVGDGMVLKVDRNNGTFTKLNFSIDNMVAMKGPAIITTTATGSSLMAVTHDDNGITRTKTLNTSGIQAATLKVIKVSQSINGNTIVLELDDALLFYKWRGDEYVLIQMIETHRGYNAKGEVVYTRSYKDVAINRDGSRLYLTVDHAYASDPKLSYSEVVLMEYDDGTTYNNIGRVSMYYYDDDGVIKSYDRPTLGYSSMAPGDDYFAMAGFKGVMPHSINESGTVLIAATATTESQTGSGGRIYAITWSDERTYIKRPINVTTSNPVEP